MLQPGARRLFGAVVVIGVIVGASACGSSSSSSSSTSSSSAPATTGQTATALKLGVLLPHTGTLAFLEPPMGDSVKLAMQDINAAGGVNGKQVTSVAADEGTNDPNLVNTSTNTLLADKVDAIIGAAATGDTLAVINKITSAPVVECSPSNTGAVLTGYPDHGYYFRTAPPDKLQSQALGNLIVADGHSNVELVGQATDYGKGFLDGLKTVLTSSGATVGGPVLYDPNATTFTAEAAKIKAAKPDAVVIIGYQETANVIKAMIQDGFGPKNVQIYVADGAQSSDLYKSVDPKDPSVLNGVKGTAPSAAPSNGTKAFPAAFKAAYPNIPSIYSAQAYDCTVIIALAASEAKSNAPTDFVKHMDDVTGGGTKCTSYAQCLGLLKQGTNIDYDGASGPLNFTSIGEPSVGTYDVWKFNNKGVVTTLKQTVVGQ